MGSARVSNAKPIPMETTDKKSLKSLIKQLFQKKKEKPKIEKKETVEEKHDSKTEVKVIQNTNTVAAILENFNKLNLEDSKPVTPENKDDELDNFTFKLIEEPRNERIHSHTSEDSGFSDTKETENTDKTENNDNPENDDKLENDEQADELAEDLEKLDLDNKKKKKSKQLQTVLIARGPTRTKICGYASAVGPYPSQDQDNYRQISQINKHTLTGGQVIVNQYTTPDNLTEIDIALESVQKQSQYLQNDHEEYLEDVLEYISEDTMNKSLQKAIEPTDFAVQERKITNFDYTEKTVNHNELMQLLQENYAAVDDTNTAVDEFVHNNLIERQDLTHMLYNYVEKELNSISNDGFNTTNYTYPTPPRSETVSSPMSASPSSFYPSNSEYTLSPERSPIYNSDYEKCQDIPHFEEEKDATDKKSRERTISASSMTMKQFKDMQKEIVCNFSKRDCCQMSRKSCKEEFQGHFQKLKMAERKNLCLDVANLDLTKAYGVLHHIMISLSNSSDKEDLHYALFGMVCDRVLAQDAALFVGDGLNLLKSAALRCPHRPLLTRYLVQCIRTALKADPSLVAGKDHIFHEVDVLGDNLVIACARAGDRCSDVLSELVRSHENQPPLFRLHHTNADGYTALHVACSQHSAANPRLHTVHVLLVHAGFDITEGDLKGRDTALHLAVNSAHCDLQLILMMFKQVDRKDWKSLAHWPNLSTKTPIDLARLATKTATRQNYPHEVLEFLKKCR